jgi:hypothetical protein
LPLIDFRLQISIAAYHRNVDDKKDERQSAKND